MQRITAKFSECKTGTAKCECLQKTDPEFPSKVVTNEKSSIYKHEL